jgi:DNA-directed RNA polymerase subunit omega
MTETRIDELLDKADSKFALVIGAAKRTRQITDFLNAKNPGEAISENHVPPPVTELMTKKPLMIAIDEIADGKVTIDYIEPADEEIVAGHEEEPVDVMESTESKKPPKSRKKDEDSILEKKTPEETMEEGEPQEPVEDALEERSEK